MNKRAVGAAYERLAGDKLGQMGYKVLEYNYRCRAGEIDIVARDGEYLAFVEVKYRSDPAHGDPALSVNGKKQKRISRAASCYCAEHGYGGSAPCRFDVASICGGEFRIIKNAFDYAGG